MDAGEAEGAFPFDKNFPPVVMSSSDPLVLPPPRRSSSSAASVASTTTSTKVRPTGGGGHSSSPLDTLLQMGFSRGRAQKALVATGGGFSKAKKDNAVQLASDWLLAHVNDPDLDRVTPRNFVLFLCPTGELHSQLATFWDASRTQVGWNGAHNSFPHLRLTQQASFACTDVDADSLATAVEAVAKRHGVSDGWKMQLERYESPNFLGLFVASHRDEAFLRSLAQDLCETALAPLGIEAQPAKSFHVTLAYQFAPAHFAALSDLARAVDPCSDYRWELRLYSSEERLKGGELHRVLFPYRPRQEDELELRIGDLVHLKAQSEDDRGQGDVEDEDGWALGTSWLTGCRGYLPKNYLEQTSETSAWTLHLSVDLFRGDHMEEQTDVEESSVPQSPPVRSVPQKSSVPQRRRVYVVRHGERVDFTFGTWVPYCFSEDGRYRQRDLNMPLSLPARAGGGEAFAARDSPLTRIGATQARLTGEALRSAGVEIAHAYSSPSLRCVQTAHHILAGLGLERRVRIHLEPGLFEWLAWYAAGDGSGSSGGGMPEWMTAAELTAAGYNVESRYKPYISAEELRDDCAAARESCSEFYTRNYFVAQCVLQSREAVGGDVLLVAHAASLDTCTRQLTGESPRPAQELLQIVRRIPYCGLAVAEEADVGSTGATSKRRSSWRLVDPPVPPLTHSGNSRFDWKMMTTSESSSETSKSYN